MIDAQTVTDPAVHLSRLHRCLEAHQDFPNVLAALGRGEPAELAGVWGSACALVAAALVRRCPGPLVVVCPRQDECDDFCDDLSLFSRARCERFPAWESDPGEQLLHDEIYGDRLRTLKLLLSHRVAGSAPEAIPPGSGRPAVGDRPSGQPFVVATSIQSLLQPVPSRQTVADHSRRIAVGDALDLDGLREWLVRYRFHATTGVELPGEFAARGGIVDIFAPDWEFPVRVELFGDVVESIRRFDISTQRSVEELPAVEVTVLAPSRQDRDHLTAFLPDSTWLMLLDPERLAEEAQRYLGRLERPDQFHTFPQVMSEVARFPHVAASGMGSGAGGATCRFEIESVERFSGDVGRVRSELERMAGDQRIHVVAQTEAELQRLSEIFSHSPLAAENRLHFHVGRLREGFRLVSDRTAVISGSEMFHRADLVRPSRRRLGKVIDSFLELRAGDLVVHLAHGIGRYRGLKSIDKQIDGRRQVEEHLEIEFHGRTKVYVPASKIDLVQKYVGGRKARPSLARIGSKTWVRQKEAARAAVTDMAAELLDLHAGRAARAGIAFPPDTDWQRAFDASFPHHETNDQLAAIGAIKSDMQMPRPMDRLLCGDVGFGKTELAIRAAFKAIDNGHQVAVLVPTTILAEQHYRTFRDRMSEFPFEIAKLSRFCSAREQREIIEGLALGTIDLVIGTHRLASSDVQFANLGLVVIDEEQRFGVELKERLKALRTSVDVLTMTATPIPRTLHFSLVGLRDISNLQTAPEDRLAVETRVARFDEKLVRHAVLRELNRGGQIYFVHNRVQDIESLARRLQRIVPEASLRIGHGQMPEHDLEKVMVDFVAGQFDLLLATTIVESGLDIPNANTIFVDEADRYGLADLHQLRGRVGRYKHRAYCYLLIDPHKHVTPNAAKRLRAIEEFSDMGAGFAIAMRDLEIRGAGNILGTEQSGHLAAVGYELYCELLEAAVRRLKKMPPRLVIDVDVDLPGEAYIPDEYVPDMRMKIDLYRRLTRVASDQELTEYRHELVDRFGSPPDPVRRMLDLSTLKLDAALWQISRIHQEDVYLVFTYTDRARVGQLVRNSAGKLRIVDETSAYLTLPHRVMEADEIINTAESVLRTI